MIVISQVASLRRGTAPWLQISMPPDRPIRREWPNLAMDQWEKRILPLINGVVETANKHLRGSGTRLRVAEGEYRGSPPCCVEIFGIPTWALTVLRGVAPTRACLDRRPAEWQDKVSNH